MTPRTINITITKCHFKTKTSIIYITHQMQDRISNNRHILQILIGFKAKQPAKITLISFHRRPYTPSDPTQFSALEKLMNAPGAPKLLPEVNGNLDRRFLPILANVQNNECLRCGLHAHRRIEKFPLEDKPFTANRCLQCRMGVHSSNDCISAAISSCQTEKNIVAKNLPRTAARTELANTRHRWLGSYYRR